MNQQLAPESPVLQGEIKKESLSVLVVNRHLLVAEAIAMALAAGQGFRVNTAQDIETALEAIKGSGCYDAVLLDHNAPGMKGLEGLSHLIEANKSHVALVSSVASKLTIERAIQMGVSGFIPKSLPIRTLGHAVQFIADNEIFLPADYLRQLGANDDNGFGLKPREMRILALLCEGMKSREIGQLLEVSESTVKMDVQSICRKLGARNRIQAVIEARKHCIV